MSDKEQILKLIDKQIDYWSEFDDGDSASQLMIALTRARLFIDSVDTVEVVRCRDCKNHKHRMCFAFSFEGKYEDFKIVTDDDFFCKWGEKE